MVSRKILGEEPLTMSEVKSALDSIRARDGELNFRAGKTDEYLTQFVKLSPEKTKKLLNKLSSLEIPRIRESHLMKLVDVLPAAQNDVKTVLQGYPITVSAENCKKIAEVISEFAEKEIKKEELKKEESKKDAAEAEE